MHHESPRKRRRVDYVDKMYSFAPAPSLVRPQIGAKKLVVTNLKQHAWDHKGYYEKAWKQLDAALTSIFADEDVNKEEMYRLVENVCRQGYASRLYSRLEARLVPVMPQSLDGVMQAWQDWKRHMRTIHSVFYFLDRSYLLSSSKLNIADLTPAFFRRALPDLFDDAAKVLQNDRRNRTNNLAMVLAMFRELSIDFEERLLQETEAYIVDTPADVTAVEELISTEMQRYPSQKLLAMLEEELVVKRVADYADERVGRLLQEKDLTQLKALYGLLDRRRLGNRLRPPFEEWVNSTGTKIVLGSADDMILQLLDLQRYLDTVLTAFKRDETLVHASRESFESFMNKTKKGDATWGTDNTKVGEMVAKYVDSLLRGGIKDDDEDVVMDDRLDQVLDLFRFVHGKAVFEAFYKKDLAKRLLMGRSASADAERSMLTRLKTECGSAFTQNLEQMFKDMELGREEMQAYKARLDENKNVDLNVNILSAAAWPTYPEVAVIIPQQVKTALERFEVHYKHKHNGRKIEWKHALAHCQMRCSFPKGVKELVVSSFQAIVLLLFNQRDRLTYSHILSETGLPAEEVKRTLQSLACAKLQPLQKHPRGRDVNDTDEFTINEQFAPPRYRVKINQIQLKETQQENKETHMRVAEDRNFECQAAIVRIMKSRKNISHSELISEVIKATMSRGVLAVGDIKKNIDRLIEKDYMEREDGGYSYVA